MHSLDTVERTIEKDGWSSDSGRTSNRNIQRDGEERSMSHRDGSRWDGRAKTSVPLCEWRCCSTGTTSIYNENVVEDFEHTRKLSLHSERSLHAWANYITLLITVIFILHYRFIFDRKNSRIKIFKYTIEVKPVNFRICQVTFLFGL